MRAAPYAGTFSGLARRLGRLFPLRRLLRQLARHRILEQLDRVRAAGSPLSMALVSSVRPFRRRLPPPRASRDVVVGNSYNTIELEGDEAEAAFYVLNVSIDAPSAERELAAALRRLRDDSLRG